MFCVVKGEVLLKRNDETSVLKENQVFITEPALLSMESKTGARLMGVQIKARKFDKLNWEANGSTPTS